jgi:hypothetical protein
MKGRTMFRSDAWTALGDSAAFANTCHAGLTIVSARDYVFVDYPRR